MNILRHTLAAVLICATFTGAMAEAAAPLPAGKPAGTQQAALFGPSFAILLGLAGVIAGAAIMASQSGNKGVTTPTTTATVGTGA